MPQGVFKDPIGRAKKISKTLKGYKHTEEAKRHMKNAQKGHPSYHTLEGDKRLSEVLTGRKQSKEHVKNQQESRRKNGWYKNPEKTKKEQRKSLERRRKRGEKVGFQKGHIVTKKHRKILSEANMREKCNFWIDGRTKLNNPYPDDWKECLRVSIRKRDDCICQICRIHQDELTGWNRQLDIHHIDYDKDNLDPDNLISLCRHCHNKTNLNRDYWENYFKGQKILIIK